MKFSPAAISGYRGNGVVRNPSASRYLHKSSKRSSARPKENLSLTSSRKKVTLSQLYSQYHSKQKIVMMTAYDYPTSYLLSSSASSSSPSSYDVDMLLVGDSLSQVALGHESTTGLTLDEMIHHCKAVHQGNAKSGGNAFVVADMPFGSFEAAVEDGVRSAIRLAKEGLVDAVKIEGGLEIIPLVRRLTDSGISVMPHIGLTPQRAISLSGYKVQGSSTSAALSIYSLAHKLQEAGASFILLEAIPATLATYITDSLSIPTIGIGAGKGCSGQVLVIADAVGMMDDDDDVLKPRFVRSFSNAGKEIKRGVQEYAKSVREESFPAEKESYKIPKAEWEGFLAAVDQKKQ